MKKLSNTAKLVIVLVVLAIVFLGLSIGSAFYSVDRTIKAIDSIDSVTYSEESENKIDTAIKYYEKLDRNLKLDTKITNYYKLEQAKKDFVRITIKNAVVSDQRKIAENLSDNDIVAFILEVDEKAEKYLDAGELEQIENYEDLLNLKSKYSKLLESSSSEDSTGSEAGSEEGSDEVELC